MKRDIDDHHPIARARIIFSLHRYWYIPLLFAFLGPLIPTAALLLLFLYLGENSLDAAILGRVLLAAYLIGFIPAALTGIIAVMAGLRRNWHGVWRCTLCGAFVAALLGYTGAVLLSRGATYNHFAAVKALACYGGFAALILSACLPQNATEESSTPTPRTPT